MINVDTQLDLKTMHLQYLMGVVLDLKEFQKLLKMQVLNLKLADNFSLKDIKQVILSNPWAKDKRQLVMGLKDNYKVFDNVEDMTYETENLINKIITFYEDFDFNYNTNKERER